MSRFQALVKEDEAAEVLGARLFNRCEPVRPANAERVRVMLLLGSLNGGGAERVAINLMNRCDPNEMEIHLGLLRRDGALLGQADLSRVHAEDHRDGLAQALSGPAQIARMLRVVTPHVLMSFGMGVDMLTWLALKSLGRRRPSWICRQDSNPDAEIAALPVGRLGRAAVAACLRAVHRDADELVVVAKDLAARLDRQPSERRSPIQTIYNPVDVRHIERLAAERLPGGVDRPFVVAAGRFVRQKGFDLLIEGFAKSRAAGGLDLVILGEGPLEADLRRQAAQLGIGERVRFPGFQTNPWVWFAKARLFCLSSRWEGFGNVVAESLATGAPTLVTNCDFGPREQVSHGSSGWVVEANDAGALAAGLDVLLADRQLSARLGRAGRSRARAFDVDVIAKDYAKLFLDSAAASAVPSARRPGPVGFAGGSPAWESSPA